MLITMLLLTILALLALAYDVLNRRFLRSRHEQTDRLFVTDSGAYLGKQR